jgi:predicted TIM-barrel fold metal-dependent hydrolase
MEFTDIEKIDAHMHYSSRGKALLDLAVDDKFSFISINTDVPFFDSIQTQEKYILDQNSARLDYMATFEMANWGSPEWLSTALDQIKNGIKNGAVAIKFWKNIGMGVRDENGNFVMLDHPNFKPIFKYLATHNIPAMGHLGEPKNCWLPLEEMTTNTDRAYFKAHPEYHMALYPEYPTYEKQMEIRDSVLKENPDLIFIGGHLASLEWSTDVLGAWLDQFPKTAVDMAERVCHLQLQAKEDWQKVRDFMIKYQDRIMYASDVIYDKKSDPIVIKETAHNIWKSEWDFFASNKVMEAHQFDGKFKGLDLPDDIIVKLYRDNALKWYPRLKNKMI